MSSVVSSAQSLVLGGAAIPPRSVLKYAPARSPPAPPSPFNPRRPGARATAVRPVSTRMREGHEVLSRTQGDDALLP